MCISSSRHGHPLLYVTGRVLIITTHLAFKSVCVYIQRHMFYHRPKDQASCTDCSSLLTTIDSGKQLQSHCNNSSLSHSHSHSRAIPDKTDKNSGDKEHAGGSGAGCHQECHNERRGLRYHKIPQDIYFILPDGPRPNQRFFHLSKKDNNLKKVSESEAPRIVDNKKDITR